MTWPQEEPWHVEGKWSSSKTIFITNELETFNSIYHDLLCLLNNF